MRKAMMWVKMAWILPAIWLSAIQSRRQEFAVRFHILQHWAKKVTKKSGVKLTVEGLEQVPRDQAVYYVSNHQGSLDPFIIFSVLPTPSTVVSKKENAKIPIIGTWFKTIEAISLDRENMRSALQMVKETAAALKSGRNVVIFPEGTRSKCPVMNEFKAGSLKPAYLAQTTVVPVALINTYVIDVDKQKDRRAKAVFLKPIRYEEYEALSTVELAQRIQADIQKELDRGVA